MATNLTSTTLTATLAGGTTAPTTVSLASVTNMVAPSAGGGILTMLLVDRELMTVESVNSTALTATVQRGQGGTKVANHGSAAIVWFGAPQFFTQFGPPGFPTTNGRFRYLTSNAIQGSLTGLGNATTDTAGGCFFADLIVERLMISTGGAVLNGVTVGTDSNAVYLYDYSGALIASSAAALTAGASAFQQRAWTQPVILPYGQYFLMYQTNGTTDTFQTIKAATWVDAVTGTQTGTAGSPPTQLTTVPTSFTANQGVIGYCY
jgi:hypothetical protein